MLIIGSPAASLAAKLEQRGFTVSQLDLDIEKENADTPYYEAYLRTPLTQVYQSLKWAQGRAVLYNVPLLWRLYTDLTWGDSAFFGPIPLLHWIKGRSWNRYRRRFKREFIGIYADDTPPWMVGLSGSLLEEDFGESALLFKCSDIIEGVHDDLLWAADYPNRLSL